MARVLVLVNPATLYILSTKDFMNSFGMYSNHDVRYLAEIPPPWHSKELYQGAPTETEYNDILSSFDAVVITHHLRICFDGWINQSLNNALLKFDGVKCVLLHDEYDNTEQARQWIEDHSVDFVYTVVPDEHVSKVYGPGRFPNTKFISILTGYMPIKFRHEYRPKPISNRDNLITYRGRISPESYGELAKEKENIGKVVERRLRERGLPADIQWAEAKRVYGSDWYALLESGKATLGTESGSNVFDEHGLIRAHFSAGGTKSNVPGILNFREQNLGFKMNQISPKLFEAIGCKTGLVLYEGNYSGVLEPNEHYLSLKHDHSNLDKIIDQLEDDRLIQKMVDRAWLHVANDESYSFKSFIEKFDQDIGQCKKKKNNQHDNPKSDALSVADFDDVLATGIGLFTIIGGKQRSSVLAVLRLHFPKTYIKIRWVYRYIPNKLLILGKIKRKLLGY